MKSGDTLFRKIYLALLVVLAFSLPLSVFLTSLVQILLAFLWFAGGNYREKWERIRANKALWILAAFYLLHLLGMAWTDHWEYGLKDLKIKLPILALPFFIVTFDPLKKNEVTTILSGFIAGNFIASMAVVFAMIGLLPIELPEYRNASPFISHIRFSLMIVLGIAIAAYYLFFERERRPEWFRWSMILVILWFIPFLLILKSLSGVVILIILVLVISFLYLPDIRDRVVRSLFYLFIAAVPAGFILYTADAVKKFYAVEEVHADSLDVYTSEGNPYTHDLENREIENGNYVWMYVCQEELKREWNRVSKYNYEGQTDMGTGISQTLIRYLTSKGLRKDAEGIQQLDSVDIRAIEKGMANHVYLKKVSLYPRIYEVIWEVDRYRNGYNPNDKSLVQRYHYLKAGFHIAMEHPWTGVGTGDVDRAFEQYYEAVDSPLRTERRRRAHNQLLTFAITFGIPGFVICIFALFYPVFRQRKRGSFLAVAYLVILLLSMLNEDTLETTTGSVFFALFYGLFIFGPDWPWKKKRYHEKSGA